MNTKSQIILRHYEQWTNLNNSEIFLFVSTFSQNWCKMNNGFYENVDYFGQDLQ